LTAKEDVVTAGLYGRDNKMFAHYSRKSKRHTVAAAGSFAR